jgi:hypothetical protein
MRDRPSGREPKARLRVYIRHLLIFLSLTVLMDTMDAAGASFEELVEQSQFIFKGTVTKLNAATLSQIRPIASTIVVKVDEVVHAPAAIPGDYRGKEVTVLLDRPGTVRTGEQFVFFTRTWMLGSSIAVREVGRMQPEPDVAITRRRVAEAHATVADNKLQNRLTDAELVVAGRVSAVRPAPEDIRRGSASEHDPDWWEAVVQIESVVKGQINEPSLVVLFPSSRDVMWESAPKFREGDEGTWVLRREKMRGLPPTHEYFTALNARDFHSKDQLDRVRRLVR